MNIGTIYSNDNSAVTCPGNTNTKVCSVTVPPGTYIITTWGRSDEIPQPASTARVFLGLGIGSRQADVLIRSFGANAQEGFSLTRIIKTSSSSPTSDINTCIYAESSSITIPANKVHLQAIRII